MNKEQLHASLESHGQESVLRFWDELDQTEQGRLAGQLDQIDFDQLGQLIDGQDAKPDFERLAAAATPPPAIRSDGTGASWSVSDAVARGESALRAGEIGAVIVAGGQGTRLGFDLPKGMFPIGPLSKRTLFEFFADQLFALGKRYGVTIPLYVMTSPATDAQTRAYFEEQNYLGLDPKQVIIFEQGTMPAVDASTGQLLLGQKDSLALSPDGHGGTVQALEKAGCIDDALSRGVKQLAYIQVDNPLANLCDPALLGHHLMAQSEMTTQVVRKRYPQERVGNVVLVEGKVQIIEYSDLPDSAAEATTDEGELKLWAGNIAVHVLSVDFLRRSSQSVSALPFHRASKKVPHLDQKGTLISPETANAIKFERFIFDLLPKAKNAFVVESLPSEAFAPVKNAEGAQTDTASLAKQAILDLHRQWFEELGVEVAPGISVEINPRYAASKSELSEKIAPNMKIGTDTYFDH